MRFLQLYTEPFYWRKGLHVKTRAARELASNLCLSPDRRIRVLISLDVSLVHVIVLADVIVHFDTDILSFCCFDDLLVLQFHRVHGLLGVGRVSDEVQLIALVQLPVLYGDSRYPELIEVMRYFSYLLFHLSHLLGALT
jgi:hypothetical protein